ncbi:MAG: hypothetical protein GYA42_05900 [Syntrophomonadaceae bacterium]|nr:hypothetical protein [Syntrophomonadaceae bacterium]
MVKLIRGFLTVTKQYNIWDFGMLKVAVFCFGLLVGAYFPAFIFDHTSFIWLVFGLASAWIVYITLVKYSGG